MTKEDIKEMLEKQLELLFKQSEYYGNRNCLVELIAVTESIVNLCKLLNSKAFRKI